jgi:hypothetical protein
MYDRSMSLKNRKMFPFVSPKSRPRIEARMPMRVRSLSLCRPPWREMRFFSSGDSRRESAVTAACFLLGSRRPNTYLPVVSGSVENRFGCVPETRWPGLRPCSLVQEPEAPGSACRAKRVASCNISACAIDLG